MRQNKLRLAEEIRNAPHAGRAKALSRYLDPKKDRDSDVDFMLAIQQARAEQCPAFRKALRDSGDRDLIHSTGPRDKFWASGLEMSRGPKIHRGRGRGRGLGPGAGAGAHHCSSTKMTLFGRFLLFFAFAILIKSKGTLILSIHNRKC